MMEWIKTVMCGTIRLDVYGTPGGRTYYKLVQTAPWRPRVLLDFDVDADGRKIDYLRLDAFWGRAPRPLVG